MRERLTKSSVEAIEPGARDAYFWDDQTPGFGLKVTPSGARIYVLKYRHRGAQRWLTLGRHGEITVGEARQKALRERGRIAGGEDPASARPGKAAAPTVDDLAARYLLEHAEPHKKPRSAEEDRRNLKLHIRPAIGTIRVADVTREDILKLHHAMREKPGAANRVLALASVMFGLAEEWA